MKNRIFLNGLEKDIYVVAAHDGKSGKIMITNLFATKTEFFSKKVSKFANVKY